jgi:hypothetical protein
VVPVRRALVVVLSVLLGLVGLGVAASPAHAKPDPAETMTVSAPVNLPLLTKQTPFGTEGGISYYFAIGSFVPFNDVAGWEPSEITYTFSGTSTTVGIGDAPYDDASSINGLVFGPTGGAHHQQLGGFSYGQGGHPSLLTETAPQTLARIKALFAPTATVTYERPDSCVSAIETLNAATDKLKSAQKKAKKASGAQAKAAAQRKVEAAKKKQKKAKSGYKAAC